MPGHSADEPRLARVVAEGPADGSNGLTQRAVRDNDVTPDAFEDLLARHDPVPLGKKQHEQIEVARNQRDILTVAPQRYEAPLTVL